MAKKTAKKKTAKKTDKAGKFVELAEARVTKAINNLRAIGKLSNKNNYSYTDEQVSKIAGVLQKELDNMAGLFANDPKAKKGGFTLD